MADHDLELCAEWAAAKTNSPPPDPGRLAALTAGYLARREEEIAARADLDAGALRELAEAREQARRAAADGPAV
jgi:hypothetical protein